MKTVLITGATGAVGEAAARGLAKNRDLRLVLAGRDTAKLEALRERLRGYPARFELLEIDLSNRSCVKSAAEAIQRHYDQLHGLVNVAAVYKGKHTKTQDGLETMFATNHLGPFQLSTRLVPLIKSTPGGKILTVSAPSSTKINFSDINGDKKFSSLSAFGASKMMNLLFAFRLGEMFKGTSNASMAFHPGLVKSDLLKEGPAFVRGLFRLISAKPEKTGNAIATLVLDGNPASQNGKFYNNRFKEMKAAGYAYDPAIQQKLWALSEEIVARA
jgi:NAD(P)-dependent dehydrogenase (short-subunit alcohol dehydrogenase family)